MILSMFFVFLTDRILFELPKPFKGDLSPPTSNEQVGVLRAVFVTFIHSFCHIFFYVIPIPQKRLFFALTHAELRIKGMMNQS